MSKNLLEAMNHFMRLVWADDGTDRPFDIRLREMEKAHGPAPQWEMKEKENAVDSERKENKEGHE